MFWLSWPFHSSSLLDRGDAVLPSLFSLVYFFVENLKFTGTLGCENKSFFVEIGPMCSEASFLLTRSPRRWFFGG